MEPLNLYWPSLPSGEDASVHTEVDNEDIIDDAENEDDETENPDYDGSFIRVKYGKTIDEKPSVGFAFLRAVLTPWGQGVDDEDLDDDGDDDDYSDDIENEDDGMDAFDIDWLSSRSNSADKEIHGVRDLVFSVTDNFNVHEDGFPPYEISFAPKQTKQN